MEFVELQTPGLSFTIRSESMEQATVTTLTATKEARSMKKKHSGNIFRYGKDLLRKTAIQGGEVLASGNETVK